MNECYIATRNKVFFMNFPRVKKRVSKRGRKEGLERSGKRRARAWE
jgi:hypothetical protein